MSDSDYPLPPPTFEFLVYSLKTQAEMQLGLYNFSGEAKDAAPNLPAARHAIDMLAMVSEKTRGNLALDEQRLVENALTELRFRFVQAAERVPQKATEGASAADHVEPPASENQAAQNQSSEKQAAS